MSVLILAEPGCTAQGDYATYVRLIETAAQCGAGCWKPQWTSDPVQMCERRHIGVDHPKRAYYQRAYSWLAFPVEWHADFKARCTDLGMQYACSVFIPQDVATVASYVDYLKIASFEALDRELLRACMHAKPARHVIMSLGMDAPANWSGKWRMQEAHPISLHCVTSYPAPLSALNLSLLSDGLCEGYSDHSRHLLAGAVAVGAGAQLLETHYRLDDCDEDNPDYAVAFAPWEFAQYIKNVRDAEVMLGSGIKEIQDCEREMLPYRVT